jgi:tetratricopeptide (TPR) repeat protein
VAKRIRVALVVITLLLGFLGYQRMAGLDERFVTISSFAAAEGLAAYLLGDYVRAAEAYRRHLVMTMGGREFGPPGTRDLLIGALDAAQWKARDALRLEQNALHARLTLGEVALARGEYRDAIAELDAVLATAVDQFDALLLKAVAQARLGLHGEAIRSLNRALRHDRVETRPTAFLSALAVTGELASHPANQRPLCLLATLHRYLRIYDSAQARTTVRYAEQAIAAGDHPADAYLTIGIVHGKYGRRGRALASFQAAVAADPRHSISLVRAARLHGERGDPSEEDRLMTAAFEAAPDDHWVAGAFDFHLTQLGDYQRAIDLNLRRTSATPQDVRAWWQLSALYLELGETDDALAATARGLALAPHDLPLRENRAMALASAGRSAEAFTEYRNILRTDPVNRRALYGLALIHRDARRYTEARRSFEMLLMQGENSLEAHNGYCEILLLLKEAAAAEACATRILRYDPENVTAQGNLGVARRMRGGRS